MSNFRWFIKLMTDILNCDIHNLYVEFCICACLTIFISLHKRGIFNQYSLKNIRGNQMLASGFYNLVIINFK